MGWKLPQASSPFAPEFSLSKTHIAQLLNEDASTLKGRPKHVEEIATPLMMMGASVATTICISTKS